MHGHMTVKNLQWFK